MSAFPGGDNETGVCGTDGDIRMPAHLRRVIAPLSTAVLISAVVSIAPAASASAAALSVPDTRVTGWTAHTVGLTWGQPAAGNWSYWVRVDSTTPAAQVAPTAGGASANVPVASPGVHTLRVTAIDAAGRRAESAPATVDTRAPFRDTVAPGSPTGTRVTGVSATSAFLSWTWAADNTGAVRSFEVSADGGQSWRKAYRTLPAYGTLWYTSLGLAPGATHRLAVRAVDAAGLASSPAFVTAATPPATDRTAPSTPANFRTVAGPGGAVTLTAEASRDDSQRVARYSLTYADDPSLGLAPAMLFSIGGTAGPPRLSINDLIHVCALGPGRYTVSLRAFDATGNVSGPSNTVTFVV
jgi:large repetitive protein